MNTEVPTHYTVADTARKLGLHQCTVRRLIYSGKLPAYRPNLWNIRVSEDDISAFIESKRMPTVERPANMGRKKRN